MTSIPRAEKLNLVDEPGLAHAFRVVLVALLTSSLAVSALTLFLRWPLIPQLTLVAAASCLIALVLSRSGRVKKGMLIALLGIAYTVLHAAVRFDGMQSIGLAILPFLIVLCALLLTRLMIVLFTVAVILTVLGMLATRYFVLRVEQYSTNDMGDLFIFALTCATAALVGRLLAVRIEEALGRVRDSESRYRRIFENVQDVYFEMRTDGILLELSPASAALFGVSPEGMIGRTLAPFCVNLSEFDALLAAVRAHGRVSNRELVLRDSRAVPRHILVNASLQTGFPLGENRVIGSIREITETKLAEQAGHEFERRFRELLEGVQLVAVMTDLDGTISFCNDYTSAITGWSKEEIIGRPAKDLLNPQTPPQMTDGVVIAPPGGQTQPFFEGSILEKNGGRRWIQWCSTPLRDSAGHAAGFASLGADVTEIRILRAEAARRESEARFQNMADTAPVMIWMSGTDKVCTFFNKGWLDFTGRSMEQELGNGWVSGVYPEDLDRCLTTYCSSFDARRTFQMEYRLRRADGEYRWILDNGVPLYREEVFAGYVGSCIDITEQRRAEAASRRSLDEIAHMNRVASMGELTASIAHEVNQPLAAILSNAQAASRFLGGESPDLAQVRECLTDIVADDKRAGEVIRRLRGLLKRGASQPSLVDLNEVVSDAIRLLGNDAMLRNVSVKIEPFPGLPAVLGDRIQLYQLALNLIMNGLEAVAERSPGDRWVLVRTAEADGGGVELRVEDSGKGIAEGDLARVFEPFFSTRPEGLGMGLSISRSIVQAHGGKISAENAVGGGAIFRCVLPAPQQTVAAAAR